MFLCSRRRTCCSANDPGSCIKLSQCWSDISLLITFRLYECPERRLSWEGALTLWKARKIVTQTKNIQLRVRVDSSSGLAQEKESVLVKHIIYNCKTRRPTNDPQVVSVADGWFYVRVVLRSGHTLQVPIVGQFDYHGDVSIIPS